MYSQPYVALGYQQLTPLSAATKLTVPATTNLVLLTAETAAVRWRDDGIAPTAMVGMLLAVGDTLSYSGPAVDLQFIAAAAGAILNAAFYRG